MLMKIYFRVDVYKEWLGITVGSDKIVSWFSSVLALETVDLSVVMGLALYLVVTREISTRLKKRMFLFQKNLYRMKCNRLHLIYISGGVEQTKAGMQDGFRLRP
jgi:hypothetical protein